MLSILHQLQQLFLVIFPSELLKLFVSLDDRFERRIGSDSSLRKGSGVFQFSVDGVIVAKGRKEDVI